MELRDGAESFLRPLVDACAHMCGIVDGSIDRLCGYVTRHVAWGAEFVRAPLYRPYLGIADGIVYCARMGVPVLQTTASARRSFCVPARPYPRNGHADLLHAAADFDAARVRIVVDADAAFGPRFQCRDAPLAGGRAGEDAAHEAPGALGPLSHRVLRPQLICHN